MDNSSKHGKNWLKSLNERLSSFLWFNWIGRTKDGVGRWIGAPKGPSERICKGMVIYGFIMGAISLVISSAMLLHFQLHSGLHLLALVGGIHGVVFTIMGHWLGRMRRGLMRLKTVEEMAEQFESSPEALRSLVEARNVRAKININNANLYDPDELIASRSLLRGADAPEASNVLLRASRPSSPQSSSGSLLRVADAEEQEMTPVQRLFSEPEDESEIQILRR